MLKKNYDKNYEKLYFKNKKEKNLNINLENLNDKNTKVYIFKNYNTIIII